MDLKRNLITSGIAIAVLALTGSVAAALSPAAANPAPAALSHLASSHGPVCADPRLAGGVKRYTVSGKVSLISWARRHGGDFAANVLGYTWDCGPGWQQDAILGYIDAGNLNARMPAHMWVWGLRPGFRN